MVGHLFMCSIPPQCPTVYCLLSCRKLVSRADSNGDSKLDKEELIAWLKVSEDRSYRDEANALFKKEDTNGDGYLTFAEFWENSEEETLPEPEEMNEAQDGVKIRFDDADMNEDGKLDFDEFVPFVHPFRHEHMIGHLVEDQLVLYDKDQDGYISLDEYISKEHAMSLGE